MFKLTLLFSTFFLITSCIKQANDKKPGDIVHFPISLADGYKICVIGDGGTGTPDQQRVADTLFNENCNEVRYAGDIVYTWGLRSAGDKNFFSKFYMPYKNMIEKQNIVFHMTMGNHDYYSNPGAWLELSKRYGSVNFPSFYYAQTYDDICFLNLDTNSKRQMKKQSVWIEERVRPEFENCKIITSVAHHPYLSSGGHGDAKGNVKKFYERSILGYTNLILSGHDHLQSDEGEVDGARLLVTGTAAKLDEIVEEPAVWGESALGYLVLTVDRSNGVALNYDFKSLDDEGNAITRHSGVVAP